MIGAPLLLRGVSAIAAHLGVVPSLAEHLDRQRQIPTFRVPHDSAPHATAAGLDDWRRVDAVRTLLD